MNEQRNKLRAGSTGWWRSSSQLGTNKQHQSRAQGLSELKKSLLTGSTGRLPRPPAAGHRLRRARPPGCLRGLGLEATAAAAGGLSAAAVPCHLSWAAPHAPLAPMPAVLGSNSWCGSRWRQQQHTLAPAAAAGRHTHEQRSTHAHKRAAPLRPQPCTQCMQRMQCSGTHSPPGPVSLAPPSA